MKIYRRLFGFTLVLLLAGCGNLGIQGQILSSGDATATVWEGATQTAEANFATPLPMVILNGQVFEFIQYIHPHLGYQLAIPDGAQILQSDDGRHTTFTYQDTNLIRGSFVLEVTVLTRLEDLSAEDLLMQITAQQEDRSEVQTVTTGGGQLTGASISYAAGLGEHCPSMRALTVVFTDAENAYVLGIRSDAEDRCDAEKLPQTGPVIGSFRLLTNDVDNLPIGTATPESTIISWKELMDPDLIADVEWTVYSGQLEGKEKGVLRGFTITYPSQWVVTANPNPTHFAVQNIPETVGGGQVTGDFVKLEVVPIKGALSEPTEGEEQVVQFADQTVTLWTNVSAPGQVLRTSLTLEKEGVYYVLAGYVNLAVQDQAALERYQMILLSMMFSFQIE